MPFPPADLFAIVAKVEDYRHFLPLCEESRVWDQSVDEVGVSRFKAELAIGYSKLAIYERFACDVAADPATLSVTAASFRGPLVHLDNRWTLQPVSGGTDVEFYLDYVMSSRMLQFILSGMFDYAMRKIMNAFEERARVLAAERSGR